MSLENGSADHSEWLERELSGVDENHICLEGGVVYIPHIFQKF